MKTICILTDSAVHAAAVEVSRTAVEVQRRSVVRYEIPDSLLASEDVTELVDSITKSIGDIAEGHPPVTLVLPLQWCFIHVLAREGKKRFDSQTLLFELEPFLPVPLESLTCTFVPLGDQHVLAIALPTNPMADLIAALGENGLPIGEIVVDVLCVALSGDAKQRLAPVVIRDNRWVRVATGIEGAQPLITSFGVRIPETGQVTFAEHWPPHGDQDESVEHNLVTLAIADSANADASHHADDGKCLRGAEAVDHIACAAATGSPNLNLRHGALAAESPWSSTLGTVNHCLGVALLIVLVMVVGLYRQAGSLRDGIEQLDVAKRQVYKQVFESANTPPGAALRVASERVRLEGLTRAPKNKSESSLASLHRPLDLLRDIVVQLPDDLRVMLLEARLEPERITLSGRTKTHRDAERLADAVGRAPGVTARTPQTNRLDSGDGVAFTVLAGVQTDGP